MPTPPPKAQPLPSDLSRLQAHVQSILRLSSPGDVDANAANEEFMEHARAIVQELERQGYEPGRAVDEAIRRIGEPQAIGAAYRWESMRTALRRAVDLPRVAVALALVDVAIAAGATFRDAPVLWSPQAVVTKLFAVAIVAVAVYAILLVLGAFAFHQLWHRALPGRSALLRIGAASLAFFTLAAWFTVLPGETAILARQAIESQVHVPWPAVALVFGTLASASVGASLLRLPYRVW